MTCNPAPACQAALSEATRRWPDRSKASDGICASAQHTANNPNSDHETGNAVDITHDPAHGCDGAKIVAGIASRSDPRVKYMIHNRKFYAAPLFVPAPYVPKPGMPYNPHTTHVHISIREAARNDTSAWFGAVPIDLNDQHGNNDISISDAAGVAAGVASTTGVPGVGELLALASFLTDGANWLRVAGFVAGLVVAGVGLSLIVADSKAGQLAGTVAAL